MKITIIVPAYNQENEIEECIINLMKQTIAEKEVICVDDGSTDNTLIKLKQLQKQYSNLIVYSQKNQGAASARNRAIEMATGSFIAFLDADDRFYEYETLEKLYEYAQENHVLICGGSMDLWINGIQQEKYPLKQQKYGFQKSGVIKYTDYQWDFGFQRFIFKQQLLIDNQIKFPLYRTYEDPPFMVEAMVAADRIFVTSQKVYSYYAAQKKLTKVEDIIDQMKGYRDELKIASEQGLTQLQQTICDRVDTNKIWYSEWLQVDVTEVYNNVLKLNSEIDWRTLLITLNEKKKLKELDAYEKRKQIENQAFQFLQILSKHVKDGRKIVLYGAGVTGEWIYKYIHENIQDAEICFAVSKDKYGSNKIHGIECNNITDLLSEKEKVLVIPAVSRLYKMEIIHNLKELKFPYVYDLDWDYIMFYKEL